MAMTEHEKLLAGQEYDYRDPEIQGMLAKARKLVGVINTTSDMNERQNAIKDLLNKTGQDLALNGHFSALYGKHISVGDNVFINGDCAFQDSNLITLGDRVIIGPDTKLYCGAHSLDATKRFGTRPNGDKYLISVTKPISIDDDVWIGGNVTIVGGVPAKLIRELPAIK